MPGTALHLGPPPARVGRQPCDRLSVFMVSWLGADAGAYRIARRAAGREMEQTYCQSNSNIAEVNDEIRGIVARNWPYLLEKLPPEDE